MPELCIGFDSIHFNTCFFTEQDGSASEALTEGTGDKAGTARGDLQVFVKVDCVDGRDHAIRDRAPRSCVGRRRQDPDHR